MRIERISVDNFLRLGHIDLSFDAPVTLLCGHNEAGKTSIRDAIQFAMDGNCARIELKRDRKHLIRDGAKKGLVFLLAKDEDKATGIERDVGSGKAKVDGEEMEPGLPSVYSHALGVQNFAQAAAKTRRATLVELLDIKPKRQQVVDHLRTRCGASSETVDAVLPMLRGGFEAAASDAKKRAAEYRAAWESLTGEKWGSQKAEGWEAATDPDFRRDKAEQDLKTKKQVVATADSELPMLNEQLWLMKQKKHALKCPHCLEQVRYEAGINGDRPALIKINEPFDEKAFDELDQKITALAFRASQCRADVETLTRKIAKHDNAEAITKQAAAIHKNITEWTAVQAALAEDGLPSELLVKGLSPLTEKLAEISRATGWDQVTIDSDLSVQVGGRPYGLCSESAQWRADAAIAVALSRLAGVGFVVLDRFDVLDAPNRKVFLKWMREIAKAGDLQVIALGTLKEPITANIPGVSFHWIEDGDIHDEMKEAS